jgi:hypothetical protein
MHQGSFNGEARPRSTGDLDSASSTRSLDKRSDDAAPPSEGLDGESILEAAQQEVMSIGLSEQWGFKAHTWKRLQLGWAGLGCVLMVLGALTR